MNNDIEKIREDLTQLKLVAAEAYLRILMAKKQFCDLASEVSMPPGVIEGWLKIVDLSDLNDDLKKLMHQHDFWGQDMYGGRDCIYEVKNSE